MQTDLVKYSREENAAVRRMMESIESRSKMEALAQEIGPGLEMALACDLRVSADDSTLGLPHLKHGLLPWDGERSVS